MAATFSYEGHDLLVLALKIKNRGDISAMPVRWKPTSGLTVFTEPGEDFDTVYTSSFKWDGVWDNSYAVGATVGSEDTQSGIIAIEIPKNVDLKGATLRIDAEEKNRVDQTADDLFVSINKIDPNVNGPFWKKYQDGTSDNES